MIDLMQHLERYIKTLSVFRFNCGRYDLQFIKSYLNPYLINRKEFEHSVMKKANDFVSFKFGDVQLLDLMKFFSGDTILDSFFSINLQNQCDEKYPYDIYSKLKNSNPLEKSVTLFRSFSILG